MVISITAVIYESLYDLSRPWLSINSPEPVKENKSSFIVYVQKLRLLASDFSSFHSKESLINTTAVSIYSHSWGYLVCPFIPGDPGNQKPLERKI